jgi:hypothetical protein
VAALLFALVTPRLVVGQTSADTAAIRAAALDYIEGWYEGNAARMERALHPDLAKRIIVTDKKTGRSSLEHMSARDLVNAVKRGGGRNTPPARRRKDVTILDVFGNAASVRVDAADWVDYLQIGRSDGRWVIVNVLWETR